MSWFTDVVRFHHKMRAPIAAGTNNHVLRRRRALLDEEWKEVCHAFRNLQRHNSNTRRFILSPHGFGVAEHERLTKELCAELVDLMYVAVGTFVEMGYDPQPVWAAIHAANMAKEPHPDGGKAVKPEGWQKARIVLRSFAGVIPLIVGSSQSREAIPSPSAVGAPMLADSINQPFDYRLPSDSQDGETTTLPQSGLRVRNGYVVGSSKNYDC